jgi:hypothetical protein
LQLCAFRINTVLENAMNSALKPPREFDEKCWYLRAPQSERLTASGVMWRGPGAARRPDAV